MDDARNEADLISLTAEIVSAFVSNNSIKSEEVANLVRETHGALSELGPRSTSEAPSEPAFTPAVSIRTSRGSRDHILSLIDGKPYKTLTRHLSKHGLTPAQYRERYGLPKTYPMVAPAYSEARSAMAKKIGLGRLARKAGTWKSSKVGAKLGGDRKPGRPPKAVS